MEKQMNLDSARSHLAAALAAGIAKRWGKFEAMSASPSVQQFCVLEWSYARYPGLDDPMIALQVNQASHVFTSDLAATALSRAFHGTQSVLYGLVDAYCAHKRRPVPESADLDAMWDILAHIFNGGLPSINGYLYRSALR